MATGGREDVVDESIWNEFPMSMPLSIVQVYIPYHEHKNSSARRSTKLR